MIQAKLFTRALLLSLSIASLTACSSKKDKKDSAPCPPTTEISVEAPKNQQSYAEAQIQQLDKLKADSVVYFNFDKYDISPDFATLLDKHASFLRENPSFSVVVEGHTDERGTPEYNIALGERRAKAVSIYLQDNGVLESQISIVSYGEEKPASRGHDEAAYSKNRRAIVVH